MCLPMSEGRTHAAQSPSLYPYPRTQVVVGRAELLLTTWCHVIRGGDHLGLDYTRLYPNYTDLMELYFGNYTHQGKQYRGSLSVVNGRCACKVIDYLWDRGNLGME